MISLQEIEAPAPEPKDAEHLYRYEEVHYSLGCDQFDNPYPGYRLELRLLEYRVRRRTPKGAWIEDDRWPRRLRMADDGQYKNEIDQERFVLLTARKQFACSTKEDALESFKARKHRQIRILKAHLKGAERALEHAEQMEKDPERLRIFGSVFLD